jgi:hypothetical protein
MYRLFRDNTGSIAYETYFNAKPTEHLLCPSTRFPKAAAPGRHEDAQPAPGCGPGLPW